MIQYTHESNLGPVLLLGLPNIKNEVRKIISRYISSHVEGIIFLTNDMSYEKMFDFEVLYSNLAHASYVIILNDVIY